MKKLLVLLLLVVCLPNPGFSCSCEIKPSGTKAIKFADVVFTGKIIKTENISIYPAGFVNRSFGGKKITISVQQAIKGSIKNKVVSIITGAGGGDCGFEFTIGNNYIIYSNWGKSNYYINDKPMDIYLTTNVCTRTTILNRTEIEEIKKAGKIK